MTVTQPMLQVSDIDFSYGQLQVLFGVSLDVTAGESLALLGTNGAGKSTLLRVISGLERPSGGKVVINGVDVTRRPAEKVAEAGLVLVPGGHAVFPDMSIDENLEIQALTARRRPGWFKERREVVFSTFPRLADRRSQRAGTLSGGEQQQLAMARALLLEPKLLCIDELSLGLAPAIVADLLDIVRGIHATGVTVVVVEQSLNVAAELCDRAVFMEKGQIRFEGSVRDLIAREDIARAVFFGAPTKTGHM